MIQLVLDNSSRQTWRQCHKKYHLQVKQGIRPGKGSTALRYGSAWHGFKEGFYQEIIKSGWKNKQTAMLKGISMAKDKWDEETAKFEFYEDYRTFDNLTTGAMKFVEYFQDDENSMDIIGTETVFELEMLPLTNEELKWFPNPPESILFTGKIDLQAKLYDIPYIIDTKSTGNTLAIESSRLHRSPQLMGYSYASDKVLSFTPFGTMVDYFHTSGRKNKDGDYGTIKYDFARPPHIFTDNDLLSWRRSYLKAVKEIMEAELTGVYDQCQDSCFDYNSACGYMSLCEQNLNIIDVSNVDGYIYAPWDVRDEVKKG